jgi:hypothetical protein
MYQILLFCLNNDRYLQCHWIKPSGRTVAIGSTQPLTEMRNRSKSWGEKKAGTLGWQPCHIYMPFLYKFWESTSDPGGIKTAGTSGWQPCHIHIQFVYKFWESQTPKALRTVQACIGIVLPLLLFIIAVKNNCLSTRFATEKLQKANCTRFVAGNLAEQVMELFPGMSKVVQPDSLHLIFYNSDSRF